MLYILRNVILYSGLILLFLTITGGNLALAKNQQLPPQAITETVNSPANQVTLININTADATTLQKIKGMSKKKVEAIINYRTQNGPFKSLEDLLKVNCRGIHKKWLQKVSQFLTV